MDDPKDVKPILYVLLFTVFVYFLTSFCCHEYLQHPLWHARLTHAIAPAPWGR